MFKATSGDLQACRQACRDCHDLCVTTLSYCLKTGGSHAGSRHIGLLLDCAEICQTSANLLLRGSELHTETCRACAVISTACAESCDKLSDPALDRCAQVCRMCAGSCDQMAEG